MTQREALPNVVFSGPCVTHSASVHSVCVSSMQSVKLAIKLTALSVKLLLNVLKSS